MGGESGSIFESTVGIPGETGTTGRQAPSGPVRIPTLSILSHPNTHRIGERVLLSDLQIGREILVSRSEPDFMVPGSTEGRPLLDVFLSRKPFHLSRAENHGIRLRRGRSRTRVRVQSDFIHEERLFSREEIESGVVLELSERVVLFLHLLGTRGTENLKHFGMVGDSTGLTRVRAEIQRIADLDVPVLVRGETGTGKELVARALHQSSPRRDKKLVSVSLGAIPSGLAASELFGAVRGAFTGAVRPQEGYFRTAHGGTLFLDEVGEAPPDIQAMLLRALETREIYPVGSQTPVRVDVRLIASTDADLEERVRADGFKAPLLHRLSSYEIWLPPLRERRDDIGRLLIHFAREDLARTGELSLLEQQDRQSEPWIPAELAARLVMYDWPGNVRQLRNMVRQLIIGSRGLPQLEVGPKIESLLQEAMPSPTPEVDAGPEAATDKKQHRKPATVSENELETALEANLWDLKATAAQLSISRTSLYALIGKHPHLRTAADLAPEALEHCYQQCRGDLDTMVVQLKVSKRALRYRIKKLGLD